MAQNNFCRPLGAPVKSRMTLRRRMQAPAKRLNMARKGSAINTGRNSVSLPGLDAMKIVASAAAPRAIKAGSTTWRRAWSSLMNALWAKCAKIIAVSGTSAIASDLAVWLSIGAAYVFLRIMSAKEITTAVVYLVLAFISIQPGAGLF